MDANGNPLNQPQCGRCGQPYDPARLISQAARQVHMCPACDALLVTAWAEAIEAHDSLHQAQQAVFRAQSHRDAAQADFQTKYDVINAPQNDPTGPYGQVYRSDLNNRANQLIQSMIHLANVTAPAPPPAPAPAPVPAPVPAPPPAPAHMTTSGNDPAQSTGMRICKRCGKERPYHLFKSARGDKILKLCEPCRIQDRGYQDRRKERKGGGGPPPSTGSSQQQAVAT